MQAVLLASAPPPSVVPRELGRVTVMPVLEVSVKRAGAAGHAASHATDVQSGSGAETGSVPLFIVPG